MERKKRGRPSKGDAIKVTFNLQAVIAHKLEDLKNRYPRVSQTDFIQAAIEYYLDTTGKGLDANLRPLETVKILKNKNILKSSIYPMNPKIEKLREGN